MSKAQEVIKEILAIQPTENTELRSLALRWSKTFKPTPRQVSQSIRQLREAQQIIMEEGIWILKSNNIPTRPTKPSSRPLADNPWKIDIEPFSAAPAGESTSFAPFQSGREGRTVWIEAAPAEFSDVGRLQLCMTGIWVPIPLNGDVRVVVGCVGEVGVHPAQETYPNVSKIRVTAKNGQVTEQNHNDKLLVIVAPKD